MPGRQSAHLDDLRRLHRAKSAPESSAVSMGEGLVEFFNQSVAKRQTKLARIAECWAQLVPALFVEHCSLESLHRGTLTVIVDSSSHLYQLKQLLLAGLDQQLRIACGSAGLRKIALKPGRWYEGEQPHSRKIRFS